MGSGLLASPPLALPTPSAVVAGAESVLPGSLLPPAPLVSLVSEACARFLQRPGVSHMLFQAWAGQGAWRARAGSGLSH